MTDEVRNRLTPRAGRTLLLAGEEAARRGQASVTPEHILLALFELGEGVAVRVLLRLNVNSAAVRSELENHLKGVSLASSSEETPDTEAVTRILSFAAEEAAMLGHGYLGTEHLLLGLLSDPQQPAARALGSLGVEIEMAREGIRKELDPRFDPAARREDSEVRVPAKAGAPSIPIPALKSFGRDLTQSARNGELDPVIGRATEIERAVQVLCRRTKNNPVLIGPAGVGKTAIVEGIAQAIASGNVPDLLRDKRLFTLDLALMIAGTSYRGQFEERIKTLLDEVQRSKNVVLFIDELHTIVGAGGAEGAMDAANIMKPALSRGLLQCIGATTTNEYRKYIEKDAALERRFQGIQVAPPNVDQAILILKGLRSKFEQHHQVTITDGAIELAARLSDRYVTDRFLPDKAVDVIDEAGSLVRVSAMSRPSSLTDVEAEIAGLKSCKESAIKSQDFENAAVIRDAELRARTKLDRISAEWREQIERKHIVVDEDVVRSVVSGWTGIPLDKLGQDERHRLLQMEESLSRDVIGQQHAVVALARALRRSRAELRDPKRPIGTFLLLGPTGVGKTHLAKSLSRAMFDHNESLIQLDMSEYMEKFSVSRLVGSPPGFVGYEEGGQLTEAVRRKPYSLVLFDELEKAHPDVLNLLLQIMEEGRLTDSQGHTVDFRNTIVLLTSNVGAEAVRKQNGMGFEAATGADATFEKIRERILEESRHVFKPEFLGRLDEVVVFRQLTKEDCVKILDRELEKIAARLEDRSITLNLDESAKEFLISNGYNLLYGARPMRRAVELHLENPLAEDRLRGNIRDSCRISVSADGEKLAFRYEQPSPDSQPANH